jgi:hypothetical protein
MYASSFMSFALMIPHLRRARAFWIRDSSLSGHGAADYGACSPWRWNFAALEVSPPLAASALLTSPKVIGPRKKDIAHRGCSKATFGLACTFLTRNQRGPNRRIKFATSAAELPTSVTLARLSTTRSRSASVCKRPTAQNPAFDKAR